MFKKLGHYFIQFLSNLSDLFETLIRMPSRQIGKAQGAGGRQSGFSTLIGILLLPFTLLFWLFRMPWRVFSEFSPTRRRDFLLGLPALGSIFLVFGVLLSVWFQTDRIAKRYRAKGVAALNSQEFIRAETLFGRLVNNTNSSTDNDRFNWALAMMQVDPERAKTILDDLAPADRKGYEPAHAVKAIQLSTGFRRNPSSTDLPVLRWHLDNSGVPKSLSVKQAWAEYYVSIGQAEKALPFLDAAGEIQPFCFVTAAEIRKSLGNMAGQTRSLQNAKKAFEKILDEDPFNNQARAILATVFVELDRTNDAENILLDGLSLKPSVELNNSISSFYVVKHDRLANTAFDEKFACLRLSLEFDPNFTPAYDRLVAHCVHSSKSQKATDKIKHLFESLIASGKSAALANLALSNILFMEGNVQLAISHVEQAYELDNQIVIVVNNLAWMIAHDQNPDLERAEMLARVAVEQAPDDPRFRDTYATVLMKMGKLNNALVEFQKTLEKIRNKYPVHEKMAQIYQAQGNEKMAKLHSENARKLGEN